jgi:hypothetical protein
MIEIHKDKDLATKYNKMAEEYKNIERQIRELQNKLRIGSDSASVAKARIELRMHSVIFQTVRYTNSQHH